MLPQIQSCPRFSAMTVACFQSYCRSYARKSSSFNDALKKKRTTISLSIIMKSQNTAMDICSPILRSGSVLKSCSVARSSGGVSPILAGFSKKTKSNFTTVKIFFYITR